jgi:hypothetical protein
MATFLDITLLQNFSIIFVFLLAWIGGYAMLLFTKVIGNNNMINLLLSLIFAIFVIMSPIATLVFESLAPVAAVLMLLVVVIYSAANMFGKFDMESLGGFKTAAYVLLIMGLVIGTAVIVRENIDVPDTGEDFGKTSTVIFHPNMLGMIFIFALAVFTIALLTVKTG